MRKSKPRPSFRPIMEALEDRWAPAQLTWTGNQSTNWSDAGNWRQDNNPGWVPTAQDDTVFTGTPTRMPKVWSYGVAKFMDLRSDFTGTLEIGTNATLDLGPSGTNEKSILYSAYGLTLALNSRINVTNTNLSWYDGDIIGNQYGAGAINFSSSSGNSSNFNVNLQYEDQWLGVTVNLGVNGSGQGSTGTDTMTLGSANLMEADLNLTKNLNILSAGKLIVAQSAETGGDMTSSNGSKIINKGLVATAMSSGVLRVLPFIESDASGKVSIAAQNSLRVAGAIFKGNSILEMTVHTIFSYLNVLDNNLRFQGQSRLNIEGLPQGDEKAAIKSNITWESSSDFNIGFGNLYVEGNITATSGRFVVVMSTHRIGGMTLTGNLNLNSTVGKPNNMTFVLASWEGETFEDSTVGIIETLGGTITGTFSGNEPTGWNIIYYSTSIYLEKE